MDMSSGMCHRYYFIFCLNAWLITGLDAQVEPVSEKEFYETINYFEFASGPDYNLLNGRREEIPYSALSHPYFNSELCRPGSIRLHGEIYSGIPINYNIHDQEVVLQYHSNTGLTRKIVLNQGFIDEFLLDGKTFRKMSFPSTGTRFFQVVCSGDLACYFYWEKKLFKTSSSFNTPYSYSKQSRLIYLYKTGQLYLIGNRSSFTGLFDQAQRIEIEHFLRQEKIRFRKISEEQMNRLIDFCKSLDGNP
jgi:hypothetical protein